MGFNSGYRSIIGRQDIVETLVAAVTSSKVAHAYIFAGESGLGKKYIAKLFAMALPSSLVTTVVMRADLSVSLSFLRMST